MGGRAEKVTRGVQQLSWGCDCGIVSEGREREKRRSAGSLPEFPAGHVYDLM